MNTRWSGLVGAVLVGLALGFSPRDRAAADVPGDLIVDGQRIELSGEHTFDEVIVRNGGVLAVAPYAGVVGGGYLRLTARQLAVDATSSITADGAGWRGRISAKGEGPGAGEGGDADLLTLAAKPLHPTGSGAGAGYGGRGGDGIHLETRGEWKGGRPYGTADGDTVELGSAGGGPVRSHHETVNYPGGNGGGAIELTGEDLLLAGRVSAEGAPGPAGEYDSGGGGSGGGIRIVAGRLTLTGLLSVRGGAGGASQDVGGHGGGGRVKISLRHGDVDPAHVDLRPGHGPCPGPDAKSPAGCDGTLFVERLPTPSRVYLPRLERSVCLGPDRRAIALVVDASDSMGAAQPGGGSLMDAVIGALDQFISAAGAGERIALISFNHAAILRQGLTTDRAALRRALVGLDLEPGSRVDAGVMLADDVLQAAHPSEMPELVVISDGQWDAAAVQAGSIPAAAAAERGVMTAGIALGPLGNVGAMRQLFGEARAVSAVPALRDLLPVLMSVTRAGSCGPVPR